MKRLLIGSLALTAIGALLVGCGGGGGNSGGNPGTVVRGGNYTLIDLGTLGLAMEPVGFTTRGAIAGNFIREKNSYFYSGTFLAKPNADLSGGSITDVTPVGFETAAKSIRLTGVNSAGQAVGNITGDGSGGAGGGGSPLAGVWDLTKGKAATVASLQLPPDVFSSGAQPAASATDISENGVIVGLAQSGFGVDERQAAFYLGRPGNLVRPLLGDLGATFLPGGVSSLAFRLTMPYQVLPNDIVVGDVQYVKGISTGIERFQYSHAFLYKAGVFTDLGVPNGFTDSRAYRINTRGQIVGEAQNISDTDYPSRYGEGKAFLYQNGVFTLLGSVGSLPGSALLAINNAGVVVGGMYTGDGSSFVAGREYKKAFLWKSGVLTDLNSQIAANSGYDLIKAVDINDAGQIAAIGVIRGEQHVVLLTPR